MTPSSLLEHKLWRVEEKSAEVVVVGVGDDLDLTVRQLKQLASRVREALQAAMALKVARETKSNVEESAQH